MMKQTPAWLALAFLLLGCGKSGGSGAAPGDGAAHPAGISPGAEFRLPTELLQEVHDAWVALGQRAEENFRAPGAEATRRLREAETRAHAANERVVATLRPRPALRALGAGARTMVRNHRLVAGVDRLFVGFFVDEPGGVLAGVTLEIRIEHRADRVTGHRVHEAAVRYPQADLRRLLAVPVANPLQEQFFERLTAAQDAFRPVALRLGAARSYQMLMWQGRLLLAADGDRRLSVELETQEGRVTALYSRWD